MDHAVETRWCKRNVNTCFEIAFQQVPTLDPIRELMPKPKRSSAQVMFDARCTLTKQVNSWSLPTEQVTTLSHDCHAVLPPTRSPRCSGPFILVLCVDILSDFIKLPREEKCSSCANKSCRMLVNSRAIVQFDIRIASDLQKCAHNLGLASNMRPIPSHPEARNSLYDHLPASSWWGYAHFSS
ncbi:uncharacterized protein EI90DRAFT_1859495 [Cantharellus anzutake]|uniref:uncharacterized protein n=1 Tax=Cantharellus anzutake TaxID=1750568 RepID=UPI001904E7D7|nr:uncharacterized protein EI90DRAFT_1859495 [Cantharellus anzutake]KAF8327029.1 hypothetical protein EI90DRAFT_1859495 [Cantharellus anzutake]